MPAPVKRFLIIIIVLALSFISARGVDDLITKYEHNRFPIGDSDSMREVISRYSEEYNIPEKVIYTVIYVRSGGDRSFSSRERIGYFALSHEELNTVEGLLNINITAEMAGKPSYNLLFGITYLNYLYSSVGDWNAVYAALLCGRDELLEWGSDRRLTDSTGSLIALPEGHAQTDMFRYYIDVEKKYAELYFSDNTKK